MTALDDIREAAADALGTMDGWQAYARTPGQVNVPAAVVAPEGIEYDADLEHGATYRLPVQLVVSQADWPTAQAQLDSACSHDGIAVVALNAMEGFDAQVLAMQDYGLVEFGGTTYLGATLIVEVFT